MFRTTLAALTVLTVSGTVAYAGDNEWSQLYRVTASGSSYQTGIALGNHGLTVATSSRFNITEGLMTYGAVAIDLYTRTPRGWLREQSFRYPELAREGDGDAISPRRIAIDENRLVFGIPGTSYTAHIASYRRDESGAWVPDPGLTLPPDTNTGTRAFSEAILDGDTLILTAPFVNTGAIESGEVWVLRRAMDNQSWEFVQRIQPPTPRTGGRFGWSISLSGDTLLITEAGRNTASGLSYVQGRAHTFTRGESGWLHAQTFLDPSPNANTDFGYSGAIDGDRIVIGSPHARPDGVDKGAAYIFTREQDAWSQTHVLAMEQSDANPAPEFGFSVDIDGDHILVGAPFAPNDDMEPFYDLGLAYLYQLHTDNSVSLLENFARVDPDPAADAAFGYSVVLTPDNAFVGAPANDKGALYIAPRLPECFRDLRGDANGDGITNFEDLNLVLTNFGAKGEDLEGDLNNDGLVDFIDLNFVLFTYASPCLPPN